MAWFPAVNQGDLFPTPSQKQRRHHTGNAATHQRANFALSLANRLYVLESGHVTATGTAEELAKDDQLAKSYFGA